MNEIPEENVIFGRHPVKEALKAGKPIDKVMVKKGIQWEVSDSFKKLAAQQKIPFGLVDGAALDRVCGTKNHQGVAARLSLRKYDDLEDILALARERQEDPLILVLNHVQDPRNLGSLIRSALGAGVHGVIIPRHRAARLTATVSKASAGADFHMKVAQVTNIADALLDLQNRGFRVAGADHEGTQSMLGFDFSGPLALVVGGEDCGLGSRVKNICDVILKIPMKGEVFSLNAGVAGAILMFKAMESR
jgi:23S rRNA (guanosine2251-2'-O)-methyltransferase